MSVIQCFSLFLSRDKLTLKTDAPDGIEQGGKKYEKESKEENFVNCSRSFSIRISNLLYGNGRICHWLFTRLQFR